MKDYIKMGFGFAFGWYAYKFASEVAAGVLTQLGVTDKLIEYNKRTVKEIKEKLNDESDHKDKITM